jgi:predicted RNase H-like HicB family nuclease
MARYIAIIDHNKDGTLFASFPDAPGCTASGKSEEDVVRSATEALAEWASDAVASGLVVPKPRSYLQLLKSRACPQLGKGGMVATVPLLKLSGKLAKANISLDAGLLETIDEEATRRGMTRSAFLASAAMEKLLEEA